MGEVKIGGQWRPVIRCESCRERMIDHGSGFTRCLSCTVPRKEGEGKREYRRRVNGELGINLRSDGRPH